MPETETGIEVKPEPPKLDPVTSLYPFLINSWSGECLEGVPHGFGRCEFKSGTVYVGNMSYGLMHGKGKVPFRDPSTAVPVHNRTGVRRNSAPRWIPLQG